MKLWVRFSMIRLLKIKITEQAIMELIMNDRKAQDLYGKFDDNLSGQYFVNQSIIDKLVQLLERK